MGHLSADDIDIQMIKTQLELADLPSVDMLIRTGGEYRISNFYFGRRHMLNYFLRPHYGLNLAVMSFDEMIRIFAGRERRFGMTSEQIQKPKC